MINAIRQALSLAPRRRAMGYYQVRCFKGRTLTKTGLLKLSLRKAIEEGQALDTDEKVEVWWIPSSSSVGFTPHVKWRK